MTSESRVVNIAARFIPRTDPQPPEGWLADRHAYPIEWDGWGESERIAINAALSSFDPQWKPPAGRFSDRHAMVVSRPGEPRFEGPVVVLMDEWCFSATDIFLGAFKGVGRVTLMGAPSSGGSARSESHDLEALGRSVRLATMASYQPSGRLYDGNGIEPDVALDLTVDDLLGRSDSWLNAAIAHIAEVAR
jgi:carboxyl-terminal processing protease